MFDISRRVYSLNNLRRLHLTLSASGNTGRSSKYLSISHFTANFGLFFLQGLWKSGVFQDTAAELLKIFAHGSDTFSVVWYLLGTWIALQVEHPQIYHSNKDLACNQCCIYSSIHRALPTFLTVQPASGRTSGSQILLSWTSNVEIVVSTR